MSQPLPTAANEFPVGHDAPNPNRSAYVQEMFNRIAPTYDFLNDCISMGMHRGWKNKACNAIRLKPGDHVLDVCTGTGDLANLLLKYVGPSGQVTGLDFSEEMLAVARQRFSKPTNLDFVQGDALKLPFEDNQFNGAIVSFGLRNVADIGLAIEEMARVVKPGGWVVNLDTAPNPTLPGYWFYFSKVMPVIGRLFSMDAKAYKYLSESTRNFLTPEQLEALFIEKGLNPVQMTPLAFGSVSIQAGQKPASL